MAREEKEKQAELDGIFQALDSANLDTKEEMNAFLDKYLPGTTQEELIKMGDGYLGPHTEKAFENLNKIINIAPVFTQTEKAQVKEAERNPLGRKLQSQYEAKNTVPEPVAKAPTFLERVKIAIQGASKNIQEAAQRATAKIDQRVAAAAEKRAEDRQQAKITKSAQSIVDGPGVLQRIKTAATDAKTKISTIAHNAIAKLQVIGKKAESKAIEMDAMKVSAPDTSTFRKASEDVLPKNFHLDAVAALASRAVRNTEHGHDAEEIHSLEQMTETDPLLVSAEDREVIPGLKQGELDDLLKDVSASGESMSFDEIDQVLASEEVSLIDQMYAEIETINGKMDDVVDEFKGSAEELLAEAEAEEALETNHAIENITDTPLAKVSSKSPNVKEQGDSFLDKLDQALADIDAPTTPKGSAVAAPKSDSDKTAEPNARRSSGPGSKG